MEEGDKTAVAPSHLPVFQTPLESVIFLKSVEDTFFSDFSFC